MKYVMIVGPDDPTTLRQAVESVALVGCYPFAPGLMPIIPHVEYTEWVKHCDALVRLDGKDGKADAMVRRANQRKVRVFWGLDSFLDAMLLGEEA